MAQVMPTQVVRTIDQLFPNAAKVTQGGMLQLGHSPQLRSILNLLNKVPDELLTLSPAEYSQLVVAETMIDDMLAFWKARGDIGSIAPIDGYDAITVIRRLLVKCPDEFSPAPDTELLFIDDLALRDNIRRDLGAVNRALSSAEWKAATVLAGATIEALLHWRLHLPVPGAAAIQKAVAALMKSGKFRKKPNDDMEWWTLHHFIEVAEQLKLIEPDTANAARLAQNFRNLIHPGRAARFGPNMRSWDCLHGCRST
jgi:hypothetical protein